MENSKSNCWEDVRIKDLDDEIWQIENKISHLQKHKDELLKVKESKLTDEQKYNKCKDLY